MASLWDRRTFNPDGGSVDDVSQTNGARAAAADSLLEWYNDRYDGGVAGVDETIIDVLANLQHQCHRDSPALEFRWTPHWGA
jgi:hypothetical protein